METITEKNFQPPAEEKKAKIVKFTNFSDEVFTWELNKIPYTFKPFEFKFMSVGVANHFAKHLVNRELLKVGRENDTSPKNPRENPFFMELYNKAIEELPSSEPMDETKAEQETIDANMKAELKKEGKPPVNKEEEFEEIPVEDDEEEVLPPKPKKKK